MSMTIQEMQKQFATIHKRLLRRIARRDKRIAGLERKVQMLKDQYVGNRIDVDQLSRNFRREIQDVLCNVRMVPVFGRGSQARIIVEDVSEKGPSKLPSVSIQEKIANKTVTPGDSESDWRKTAGWARSV